jgi:hypothetical protein
MIEGAKRLSDGIWLAPLLAKDAQKLGHPKNSKGGCSVILLKKAHSMSEDEISFEPNDATLLNIGEHDFSIFIEPSACVSQVGNEPISGTIKSGYQSVIQLCNRRLPKGFLERVVAMLNSLSEDSQDDLVADKTNRWISRPDNYFTIKVQPQKRDLVVTIRGKPEEYTSRSIKLSPDQNGYSRFWIRDSGDIVEAMKLIRSARARGRLR